MHQKLGWPCLYQTHAQRVKPRVPLEGCVEPAERGEMLSRAGELMGGFQLLVFPGLGAAG